MTKNEALKVLIQTLNACELNDFTDEQKAKVSEAIAVATKMSEQLSKPRTSSPEAKEKRKAVTAAARAELVAKVAPVLRKYLDVDRTAKELCEVAASELPENFSWQQVQNVLLREMAEELVKTEAKGKANTYRLK